MMVKWGPVTFLSRGLTNRDPKQILKLKFEEIIKKLICGGGGVLERLSTVVKIISDHCTLFCRERRASVYLTVC